MATRLCPLGPGLRTLMSALTIVVLAWSLQGCGYHLRGAGMDVSELPLLAIEGGRPDGVRARIETLLTSAKVPPVARDKADLVLVIAGERFDERSLSISEDARVRELELTYRTQYDLVEPSGKPLQKDRTVMLQRIYSYDNTQLLGKTEERAALEREMLSTAARQILRDLLGTSVRRRSNEAQSGAAAETGG